MNFYKELSSVYDIVFEKDDNTVTFLEKCINTKCEVLDLACGTGIESIELAKDGNSVIGIDLDEDMIEKAKGKANGYDIKFYCEDMTKFTKVTGDKKFDMIYCIGNSLVHLNNKAKVKDFIKGIYSSLKNGGCMVIQIINFDRIIDNGVTSLPTIDKSSEGVKFIRNYNVSEDKQIVHFETELTINNNEKEKVYKNSVPLLALRSKDMVEILKDSGFYSVELFGNFKESSFNKESYALILKCFKSI